MVRRFVHGNTQGFSHDRRDRTEPIANRLESDRTDREPVEVVVTRKKYV